MVDAARPRLLLALTRLERGGAQFHVLTAAKLLESAGWEVHLATGSEDELTSAARGLFRDRLHEIPALVRPLRPASDLAARRALARLLRDLDPDVAWSHSSKAGILLRSAAVGSRAHVVHAVHGFAHPGASDPLRRRLYIALERRAATQTDTYVFFSRADLETARALGLLRRARAEVLPYGVDLSGFDFAPGERERARERSGLAPGRPTLSVVANLKAQKAPEATARVVRAFLERHPDWQLLWAGDGPAKGAVQETLRGFEERVRGPHWVRARRDAFAAADAVLLFSKHEGLPNCVIEGLGAGLPVVASRTEGAAELLDGRPGHHLVPIGDEAAASRALDEMVRRGPLDATEVAEARRGAEAQARPALARRLDPLLRGLGAARRDEMA